MCVYGNLIQGHPQEFAALKQCDHPILSKVEDLVTLAESPDVVVLTRLLCGLGITPDDRKSKPCTLQEAQKRLAQYRAEQARENQPPQYKASGNSGGQELPPPPAENPISPSTLVIPASSSALVLRFRNENQVNFLFPRLFTGCQL